MYNKIFEDRQLYVLPQRKTYVQAEINFKAAKVLKASQSKLQS